MGSLVQGTQRSLRLVATRTKKIEVSLEGMAAVIFRALKKTTGRMSNQSETANPERTGFLWKGLKIKKILRDWGGP